MYGYIMGFAFHYLGLHAIKHLLHPWAKVLIMTGCGALMWCWPARSQRLMPFDVAQLIVVLTNLSHQKTLESGPVWG